MIFWISGGTSVKRVVGSSPPPTATQRKRKEKHQYAKLGSRNGVMVRALTSCRCDPGFDSRTRRYHVGRVCCWFSSLL